MKSSQECDSFYPTIDYSVPVVCKMDISSGNLHFASVFMCLSQDLSIKGPLVPSLLKELQRVVTLFLKYPNNNLHLWECMRVAYSHSV